MAGSRSIGVQTDDFTIESSKKHQRFIHVAGISSPGLSAAPAIAHKVISLIKVQAELKEKTKVTKDQLLVVPMTAVG
jgi:glycerol-3-phosphate dehydrogenase